MGIPPPKSNLCAADQVQQKVVDHQETWGKAENETKDQ